MFNIFAHAGNEMEGLNGMSDIDHCMPIIIGAGIIIVILISIIAYLLTTWQPRNLNKTTKKKTSKG